MRNRLTAGTALAALALAVTALPVTADFDRAEPALSSALAKGDGGPGGGNGGGPGGGNGGGPGNGNGGGPGNGPGNGHGASAAGGLGKGQDKAGKSGSPGSSESIGRTDHASHGHAFGRDAVSGVGIGKSKSTHETKTNHGLTASSLGRLNAAHANENALENAAPHSAVGLAAQFAGFEQQALEAATEEEREDAISAAAAALAAAANKEIDPEVVGAVNDLLGMDVDPTLESEIAGRANEAQASETSQGLGGFKDVDFTDQD
jgi:hypothetical protein